VTGPAPFATYGVLGLVLAHLPEGVSPSTTTTHEDGLVTASFADEDHAEAVARALGLSGPVHKVSGYLGGTVYRTEWTGRVGGHRVQIDAIRFADGSEPIEFTPTTAEEA
jgi:hypothetical protein